MEALFIVVPEREGSSGRKQRKLMPLAGAVLRNNSDLFERVYNAYREVCGNRWTTKQVQAHGLV